MKHQNSYQESLQTILSRSAPLAPETVSFHAGLGRILAEDIVSEIEDPPAAKSAMDGYCLQAQITQQASSEHPLELPFSGALAAGHLPGENLIAGQAIRIMTGALLPRGADAVVKQEDVDFVGQKKISLKKPLQAGENVIAQGAHISMGQPILKAGLPITPQVLGMLAKLGKSQLQVYQQPRVAILAIGDELVEVGRPLQPGQLYVSNLYAMAAMIRQYGGIPQQLGIAKDDPHQIETLLRPYILPPDCPDNSAGCDLILTLGGSWKGDFDFAHTVLERLGAFIHFRSTAINLGPSTIFATLGKTLFFGLPGTPVPSWGAFELLMRPGLWKITGCSVLEHPRLPAQLATDLTAVAGSQCFFPGWLVFSSEGLPQVTPLRTRGTETMPSALLANVLIEVEEGKTALQRGEVVKVQWTNSNNR